MDKLSGESLMKADTDPTEAQKIIQRVKKEFDDSVGKLNKYKQYQDSLEIAAVEIQELKDFQKKYEIRSKLWNNLKNFREKSNVWFTKSFREQEVNDMITSMKEFERDNLVLKQQLPKDTPDLVHTVLT